MCVSKKNVGARPNSPLTQTPKAVPRPARPEEVKVQNAQPTPDLDLSDLADENFLLLDDEVGPGI